MRIRISSVLVKISVLVVFLVIISKISNADNFKETPIIDSLKRELAKGKLDKISIFNDLIFEYTTVSIDSAERYVQLLLSELKNASKDSDKANAFNEIGHFLYRKGYTDSARYYYERAISYCDPNIEADQEIIARSTNLIGVSFFEDGNFEGARKNYFNALRLYQKLSQKPMIASSLNNIGNLYHRIGNYDSAIYFHNKALKIKESIGDKRSIAFSLANIGNLFLELSDLNNAEDYYSRALQVFEEINHMVGKHYIMSNLSLIYNTRKDHVKSLEYSLNALKVANAMGDHASIGATYSDLGRIYFAMGEFDKAIEHYNYGIDVLQKYGPKRDLPFSYVYIGAAYLKKKDYRSAIEIYKKSIELCDSMNDLNNLLDTYQGISEAYSGIGDAKGTFSYFEKYKKLRDSLQEETIVNKVEELQALYDSEKKEHEILILNEENKLKEAQLKALKLRTTLMIVIVIVVVIVIVFVFWFSKLKQKQKLIKIEQKLLRTQMNPHFIFNAVSAIQNFIMNNKPLEACGYLSDFAKLMRLILENSRDDFISLENEIDTLEKYFEMHQLNSSNSFNYEIIIDEKLEKEELAIPPMIAQPFVENAILHGIRQKPEGAMINVFFKSKDTDKLEIIIEDNGSGRKTSEAQTNEKHKSLAMEITKERLEIVNSSSKVKSNLKIVDIFDEEHKPSGTKIILTLPLKYL